MCINGARSRKVSVLVVGAGPTGLGAAVRLHQHGHSDWLLLDQAPQPGGLSCTATTPEGFLFDMGGHVIFSHWEYFDQLLNAAVGTEGWNILQRVSYVWIRNRWVAYPFQNNIAALDKDDQIACLTGLIQAKVDSATASSSPVTFDNWIMRVMGQGIADLFMRPYNFKVWGVPTTQMQCKWLGERVATVDINRAVSNVIHNQEDAGWGPNAVFRFPKRGGTGAIWKGVARLLPADKQQYGVSVTHIDPERRQVVLSDGSRVQYGSLISTIPLDVTLRAVGQQQWADGLTHSSSHIIGVGIRGPCPLGSKCWLYFPEANCPFYRATVFSNYAEGNCPPAHQQLPTLCLADGSTPAAAAAGGAAAAAAGGAAAAAAVAPPTPEAIGHAKALGHGHKSAIKLFATAGNTATAAAAGAAAAATGHAATTAAAAAGGPDGGAAAAAGGPYWSLMFEVTESSCKPVDQMPVTLGGTAGTWPAVVRDTLLGAVATQLLQAGSEVVSLFHRRLEHGYPTPSLGRDAVLEQALPWLQETAGIWSRGRFGSYKYEVGNQDHSLMLGVEAADNILFGTKELTLNHPDIVNASKNPQPCYTPTSKQPQPLSGRLPRLSLPS